MASERYSFIDIAVLDPVRERFAAGDALVILSSTLEEITWANGPGALLFGYATVEAAIGSAPGLSPLAMRQVRAARGFPEIPANYPLSLRMAQGTTGRPISLHASGISLPGGETAILLMQPVGQSTTTARPPAQRAVSGFASDDYIAAIVDAGGKIEAASRDMAKLRLGQEVIRGLVHAVARERDRLVKKLVEAEPRRVPAGIARLTDDPALHLLVIAETPAGAADQTSFSTGDRQRARQTEAGDMGDGADASHRHKPANGNGENAGHADHWYFKGSEDKAPPKAEEGTAIDTSDRLDVAPHTEGTAEPISASGTRLPSSPLKFVWRTDADGRFNAISEEFVRTLGDVPDDIIGQRFADIAAMLGFDEGGEIARLLERRDTWSGRSVMWPAKGAGLSVPVDLAGLPIYSRERKFEGFRGFGVARFGEAVVTPPRPSATSSSSSSHPGEMEAKQTAASPDSPNAAEKLPESGQTGSDLEVESSSEPGLETHDPFEGEPPALTVGHGQERRFSDKIIRLAEHRPPLSEGGLSSAERHAFREIGARLKKEDASKTPEKDQQEGELSVLPATVGERAGMPSEREAEQRDHDAQDAPAAEAPGIEADYPEAGGTAARKAEGGNSEMTALPADETDDDTPAQSDSDTGVAQDVEPSQSAMDAIAEDASNADKVPQEQDAAPTGALLPEMRPGVQGADTIPSALFLPPHVAPELYSSVLSSLPLPVLIHAGDILHYANPHLLELVGYSSIDEIRDAGGLGELFADPISTEDGKDRKLCLKHRSGETFPVGAFLQSIPWGSGKALLMALQRGEAPAEQNADAATLEVELLKSRVAELGAIIDTATDGVVLIDKDGSIRSISRPAEALFGFDSAQVVGKPFAFLFAIESQRAARDYLASLSDNGVASVLNDGLELIGREAEGRFIPLFMTIGRLPHENGYCAVVRDVTPWKRAEEELTQARSLAESASSQKTDFLARISHEIRTPLNAIIGFSELIMDEKFGPVGNERYRDYLRDINRSGNHVLDLVNDLLDISKIEAGEQEMNYEAVSLNETLAETVAMMQPQANRERVIIRSSFLSRLPEVVADLRSMRQIALNLMSNAIRYTQAGGQVIVSTAYEPSGEVVMRVRDTGVGMSQVEIEEALKPFKQLNALKRPRGDGTGLGLPLTKAMVEANRARFSVNSIPGEGTLVEISFPSTRVLAD